MLISFALRIIILYGLVLSATTAPLLEHRPTVPPSGTERNRVPNRMMQDGFEPLTLATLRSHSQLTNVWIRATPLQGHDQGLNHAIKFAISGQIIEVSTGKFRDGVNNDVTWERPIAMHRYSNADFPLSGDWAEVSSLLTRDPAAPDGLSPEAVRGLHVIQIQPGSVRPWDMRFLESNEIQNQRDGFHLFRDDRDTVTQFGCATM